VRGQSGVKLHRPTMEGTSASSKAARAPSISCSAVARCSGASCKLQAKFETSSCDLSFKHWKQAWGQLRKPGVKPEPPHLD